MATEGHNSATTGGGNVDSIVLEEEIDPNYVPTESEVVEYAKWLGMDLDKDQDLFWVAKEGLMAPLPKNWKPCKTKDTEDIYYFNFASGESTWDHPCDGYYKRLFEDEKKKKELTAKDKADENRTQAKADVEKLLGKDEKKKKKKKNTLSDIGSIGSPANKKSGSTSSKSSLPKPSALGPIGGSKPLEKAALPGISGQIQPMHTSINSKSDISLLSTSDGTGASIKDNNSNIKRVELDSPRPRDTGSGSGSVNTKRSKMSMRLSSVVATSDELQLDCTPTKSADSFSNPVVKAKPEVKEEAKPEASMKSPTRTQRHADSDVDQSKAITTDKVIPTVSKSSPKKNVSSETAVPLEAEAKEIKRDSAAFKPTTVMSSSLSVSSDSFVSDRDNNKQIVHLEGEIRKKNATLESLRLELQDAERRIARATQRQGVAEETETALQRKLDESKRQYGILEQSNSQLDKENRDIRSVLQKKREDVDDILDKDEQKAEIIDSLKEEVRMNASSERRAVEMQSSLREELATQANFYETKIRSSDLVITGLKEDLARTEKMWEVSKTEITDLTAKYTKEQDDLNKSIETLKQELEVATAKINEVPVVSEKVKEVEVIKEVVVVKDSPDEYMEELTKLNKTVIRLNHELNQEKAAVEDANMRSRRFEQMSISWESDCKDKEARIVSSRTRCNEVEDKCTELESENRKLLSQFKLQKIELEAASASAESAGKLRSELTAKGLALSTLQDTLNETEKKSRILLEETAILKQKIQKLEKTKSDSPAERSTTTTSVFTAELENTKKTLLEKEMIIVKLNGEIEGLKQHTEMLVEKNKIVEANAESSFDGISEEASMWKQKTETISIELQVLHASKEKVESELAEKSRLLIGANDEVHNLKMNALKANETIRVLGSEKDYAIEEQHMLRTQLNAMNEKYRDADENLMKARHEALSKATECSNAQFILETEKRARETQDQLISDQVSTIDQLRRSLREGAPPMVVAPPVAAAPTSISTIDNDTKRGIVDLSVKIEHQSSAISTLEKKLSDAMDTIIRLKQNTTNSKPQPELLKSDIDDVADLDKSALIKEMILEFVQRRKPLANPKGESTSNTNVEHNRRGVDYWKALLLKENKFITEARRVLKEEKAAIRWEQQQLLKRREQWKSEGQNRSSGTQQILNQQTVNLNTAVETARHTSEWLSNRERKLNSLQQLIDSSGSQEMDMQINKLATELDNDMLHLTPGYHGIQGSIPIPSSIQTFYQKMDQQQATFFPVSSRYSGRNTYLEARAENLRPVLRNSTRENVPNTIGHLLEKQEARQMHEDIEKMTKERAMVNDEYEEHIGWLASLRKDINNFRPEANIRSPERNEKRYSGRAFIDAVVQEKFEL
jgi:hypothetical protein